MSEGAILFGFIWAIFTALVMSFMIILKHEKRIAILERNLGTKPDAGETKT